MPKRAPPIGDGVHVAKVTLAHGGGGKAMRDLIDDVFVSVFDNPMLTPLEDQARMSLAGLARHGDRLAFTSDSFVVDPLEFPGGDIGKLAVCGTVNDLAVGGAKPLYLSCCVIIEEGVDVALLRKIARSMAETAATAGVAIVTGDTKVVKRGCCDKLFINTAGVGVIGAGVDLGADRAGPGDVILVNGLLGDHGAAIFCARGDLALEAAIESDCAALNGLIETLLARCPDVKIHARRDARRPRDGGQRDRRRLGGRRLCSTKRRSRCAKMSKAFAKSSASIRSTSPMRAASSSSRPPGRRTRAAALAAHPLGRDAAIIGRVTGGRPDAWRCRPIWRQAHRRHAGRRAIAAHLLRARRCTNSPSRARSSPSSARQAKGRKVTRVTLEIGKLSAIMPDAIRFCFDVVAQGQARSKARRSTSSKFRAARAASTAAARSRSTILRGAAAAARAGCNGWRGKN